MGYDKICQELNAIELDRSRDYTLLKIDGLERFTRSERDEEGGSNMYFTVKEPVVLLKTNLPSQKHIYNRVPPEMTSVEAAMNWVNLGIIYRPG